MSESDSSGSPTRRGFLNAAVLGLSAVATGQQRVPLKVGHRAASMKMVGNFDVFKMAREIPGLLGVELQVTAGNPNLHDWEAVRRYKREAHRWGIMIPSLAGLWEPGVSIRTSPAAGVNLLRAIRVAEFLGARVILAAFFRDNAPDMNDESSYGPVVQLLNAAAPTAAEAGVIIGLENSLSPADNKKLVDLVNHRNVKVYYDLYNMAHYGHAAEVIPGLTLLGTERICQVHVKNGEKLLSEPGPVDWPKALETLNRMEYEDWYVLETQHNSREKVIEDTTTNIEFLRKHCRMPAV
jgi:L-ribulose-5-phosphate 3-epimerase